MIETQVSKGIISTYFDKLQRNLQLDVASLVVVLLASLQLIIWQKQGLELLCSIASCHLAEVCGVAQ